MIIPSLTTRTARDLYSQKNGYIQIGDHLESIIGSVDISKLDPANRLTLESSIRLTLVTAFQLAEGLPDALAVQGVLDRVDWKYALDLPMGHLGITTLDLCHFRQDLFSSKTALKEFGVLLSHLKSMNLFINLPDSKLDPSIAITTICLINRTYSLHESRSTILNMLIATESEGALRNVCSCWYDQYKIGTLSPFVYPSNEDLTKDESRLRSDIQKLVNLVNKYKMSRLTGSMEILKNDRTLKDGFCLVDNQLKWELPVCDLNTCVLHLSNT